MMDEDNEERISHKIVELLDKAEPRPDIIDSLKILHRVEDGFLEALGENLKDKND